MPKSCLLTIARQELTRATNSPHGRSERVLFGDQPGSSRISVLALRAAVHRPEPLETAWTVQVLAGRVRLRHPTRTWVGFPGDLITGPAGGSLTADADAAVLLSLASSREPNPTAAPVRGTDVSDLEAS